MNCGQENPNTAKYCINCGVILTEVSDKNEKTRDETSSSEDMSENNDGSSDRDFNNYYRRQSEKPYVENRIPKADCEYMSEENRPLSTWEYFGYIFLFSIPLLGFVFLLIFSFGASRNKNVRNLSKAYLIFFIIALVLSLIFFACGMSAMIMYS